MRSGTLIMGDILTLSKIWPTGNFYLVGYHTGVDNQIELVEDKTFRLVTDAENYLKSVKFYKPVILKLNFYDKAQVYLVEEKVTYTCTRIL